MASFKAAYTPEEVKHLGVAKVREAYNQLAEDYNKIFDRKYLICPVCGDPYKAEETFYMDDRFVGRRFPICKRCIQKMVEQRKTDKDEPNETKESVMKVLQLLDRPYLDDTYEQCVKGAADGLKEKNRRSPFATYIVMVASLPQFKGKTWKDSQLPPENVEDEVKVNNKTLKNAIKRFGYGYSNEDYMFLENEYQDWVTRYECNTKAQEEAFERLSFKKWEIYNATKKGLPTKDLDKTYQEWLGTANIQPRQTSMDATADAQTFGTLIQKYEETRPLPEIDPDLEDVDKIGLMIDVFYRGHASKMLGLKNTFSHLYERFMQKYTVNKPEYNEEDDSETIFEKVFGAVEDDE